MKGGSVIRFYSFFSLFFQSIVCFGWSLDSQLTQISKAYSGELGFGIWAWSLGYVAVCVSTLFWLVRLSVVYPASFFFFLRLRVACLFIRVFNNGSPDSEDQSPIDRACIVYHNFLAERGRGQERTKPTTAMREGRVW